MQRAQSPNLKSAQTNIQEDSNILIAYHQSSKKMIFIDTRMFYCHENESGCFLWTIPLTNESFQYISFHALLWLLLKFL